MSRNQYLFECDVVEIRDAALFDLCILTEYLTEADDKTKNRGVIEKLAEMLSSLCTRIRKAITTIKNKISKKIAEDKYKRELKKLRNCKEDKQVEFIDVWKYEKYFKKEVRELCRLCDEWTDSYTKNGASVGKANRFEKHYRQILDIYEPEIEKIKKTKIKTSSQKVRKWILNNIQSNGDPAGMLLLYTEKLENCEKTFKDVLKKREEYIAKTGYDNGPASFTKFVTNSSLYVHRNSDWLSMFAVSSLSLFSGWMLEKSDKKEIGKFYKPDHTEPEVQRQERKQFENEVYEDPDYISKKKKASKIMRKGSVATAAMGAYTKMKSTNRTTI